MGKDTTIKDIAEAAGVSHSTVSRVLNNNPRISQETKDRIRRIASDMGYSVNYVARSLVKKRSDLIGLVLTSINDPFMSEHVQEIEQRARDFGYNIILSNTNENADREANAYNLLRDRQVDGIIFFPVNSNSIIKISKLDNEEIP